MSQQRFNGQVAIVTGGGSGIGAAIAERLVQEGARVCLVDSDAASLERQHARLTAIGGEHRSRQVDIRDPGAVAAAFDAIVGHWHRLDVLVHCAGVVGATGVDAHSYPVEEFRRVLDVNLTGAFIVSQCALSHMLGRRYGRILLLASMAGKDGNPGMAGYVASKAGLIGLAKALGKEYACAGITINALAPAVIATPMNAATDPAVVRQLTDKIPMKRMGTVEEAAAIASWICSEEASFNTGAVFDLSGGRATY